MGRYLLPALVFWPMLAAPVSFYIGRGNKSVRDLFVALAALVETAMMLLLLQEGEFTFQLSGVCYLGLSFRSGSFHSLMGLLTALGWLAATLLSKEYFEHLRNRNRYYMFWLVTLGATMGVFFSADLVTTFIFFEIMSFTSYVAVIHTEEEDALQAASTYLAVAVIGGLVTVSGLFVLNSQLGTLEFSAMAAVAEGVDPAGLWLGGLLTLTGFAAKAGAFPLHIWLPTAHPAAPAPASAVLSGVITKTGIYGVLVLSTTLFLHDGAWGLLLAGIGGVTMVLGAVLALFSIDLKRTLACSSISQIGFILVGIAMQCLLGEHNALAVDGTTLHILNHSMIKMVLFPAAGIIHLSTHSFDLNDIQGFGRHKQFLMGAMGIPMLSLAGLPLLNGYVSKTLLHESIVELIPLAGELGWLFTALEWLFLFSGGLTFAYMLKLFVAIFVEKHHDHRRRGRRSSRHGRRAYIAPLSAGVLMLYVIAMPVLGLIPNLTMDNMAAFARAFFHGHAPEHQVAYFSWVNLRGAAISLAIGGAIYLTVVRRLLRGRDETGCLVYVDRWPRWLDLEQRVYRPLVLVALPRLAKAVALVPDLLVNLAVDRMADGLYWNQASTVEPGVDRRFGRYEDEPAPRRGFTHSLSFGLLLMGLGLAAAILYILL